MISIIMSVYNNQSTISLTINSILNQTFKEFEFIIVDDCSTDNSIEIIKEYERIDNRIIFIHNDINLGLPTSLNKAIKIAKYNYIARIDGDDICMLDRFEKQIKYINKNSEIDVLGCGAILINQSGDEVGSVLMPQTNDEIKKAIRYKNPMIHPSIVMKKSVLKELGGYDEKLRKAQDLDLWERAANNGKVFYNLQEHLIRYRIDLDKSYSTIFKGFKVSFLKALRYKSFKGLVWSILELIRYLLVKLKLYTPKSMRNNEK